MNELLIEMTIITTCSNTDIYLHNMFYMYVYNIQMSKICIVSVISIVSCLFLFKFLMIERHIDMMFLVIAINVCVCLSPCVCKNCFSLFFTVPSQERDSRACRRSSRKKRVRGKKYEKQNCGMRIRKLQFF